MSSNGRPVSAVEVENMCHWGKQLCALSLGLTFGATHTTGGAAIITFLLSTALVTWVTYARILNVSLGQEGKIELFKEGLMPAASLCACRALQPLQWARPCRTNATPQPDLVNQAEPTSTAPAGSY